MIANRANLRGDRSTARFKIDYPNQFTGAWKPLSLFIVELTVDVHCLPLAGSTGRARGLVWRVRLPELPPRAGSTPYGNR
jgi:hypothetical protein